MSLDNQQSFLKGKDGKYLTVKKAAGGLKLVAVEIQNGTEIGQRVCIVRKEKEMAFYFKRGNGYCLPMVKGGKLGLEQKDSISDDLPPEYWFKKKDLKSSEHYGLGTVVTPIRYLCRLNSSLGLSLNNECVPVTDEKIDI